VGMFLPQRDELRPETQPDDGNVDFSFVHSIPNWPASRAPVEQPDQVSDVIMRILLRICPATVKANLQAVVEISPMG
jgi:hypothetical protein